MYSSYLEVFTHLSSFTSVTATVTTTAQGLDIHSFDNTELKRKISKAVI
jgi:hypothetical protein